MPTPIDQLSKLEITETDIFEALLKLDTTKARDCDNISSLVLKQAFTTSNHFFRYVSIKVKTLLSDG